MAQRTSVERGEPEYKVRWRDASEEEEEWLAQEAVALLDAFILPQLTPPTAATSVGTVAGMSQVTARATATMATLGDEEGDGNWRERSLC